MRALVAVLLAVVAGDPAAAQVVEYLYIRANQGGSSGGHVALRVGDEVYDFQRERGLVRLRRDDARHALYRTRILENRPIEALRIALDEDTALRLRAAFERRHLVEARRLALWDGAQADVRLLEAFAARERGAPAAWQVAGAGFFPSDPGGPASAAPEALAALRVRVAVAHGAGFVAARRGEVDAALAALVPVPAGAGAIDADPLRYPAVPDAFSRRYEELLAQREALAVLDAAGPRRGPPALADSGVALDDAERAHLRGAREGLLAALTRLAASPRPDWGHPLLLGTARLAALDASIERGRLLGLDAFPATSESRPLTPRSRAWLPELAAEAEADLAAARTRFFAAEGWRESAWSGLETAASRWREVQAALHGAPALRLWAGHMVPEGRAAIAPLPVPVALREGAATALGAARTAERAVHAALVREQGYDLLRRNCVSEIFGTVDAALGEQATDRLGGHVEPAVGLGAIPFVSARRVRQRWAVAETRRLPSYRQLRLAEMAAREGALWVGLRESNVATATAYRGSDRDGFFVFFTDERVALRPLLGALNLAAGLGRGGLGVLALPFDGGRGLRAGLEGAFWSLPELFFQNVRKGSNDYVPPAERPPPA